MDLLGMSGNMNIQFRNNKTSKSGLRRESVMLIDWSHNSSGTLSSPVPKPLVPKTPRPTLNQVLSYKTQLVQKGLGLTLKSCRPPTTP